MGKWKLAHIERPTENGRYLVTTSDRQIVICNYDDNYIYGFCYKTPIIAWRKLPKRFLYHEEVNNNDG